nr:uncharacterized protein LOC110439347 [Danio rerio]|eukprot:XP_021330838.1 uncharacterized protein LOC110439347 [Danio rerio]
MSSDGQVVRAKGFPSFAYPPRSLSAPPFPTTPAARLHAHFSVLPSSLIFPQICSQFLVRVVHDWFAALPVTDAPIFPMTTFCLIPPQQFNINIKGIRTLVSKMKDLLAQLLKKY